MHSPQRRSHGSGLSQCVEFKSQLRQEQLFIPPSTCMVSAMTKTLKLREAFYCTLCVYLHCSIATSLAKLCVMLHVSGRPLLGLGLPEQVWDWK